ncbi:MAG TPA: aminoglycoside phosphotransferase family protein [Bacteroidales bacterium]|nr:aminoglycoside phosphotransferase family protein [Bacteroidales bacterium]
MSDAQVIVTHFCIPEHVTRVSVLGEGFINDTFLVETASPQKYILQRKNRSVFHDIPGMMANIDKVTRHIRSKGAVTLTLVPGKNEDLYYIDNEGEYWTCCTCIPDTYTYEQASDKEMIRSGGEGIGMFHSQMADFRGTLTTTLPGFHNIRYRFRQFSDSAKANRAGRLTEVASLVKEIYSRQENMESFYKLIAEGIIPERVSHNDTKLSNFLFDAQKKVVCAIDLDTVMQTTVLYDFGDAVRSYANAFAEDHPVSSQVVMDPDRFYAFSEGYASRAAWFLNDTEKTHLAYSALYITYEQFLRFLMDYIDGDTYYRIRYPTHNLVRAQAQLALLKSMEDMYPQMQQHLKTIFKTL